MMNLNLTAKLSFSFALLMALGAINTAVAFARVGPADRTLILGIGLLFLVASIALYLSSLRSVALIKRALSRLADQLARNSLEITAASREIASASEQLFRGTSEQAAALQETASSMAEINAMLNKNAESALKTSERANVSHQSAMKGKAVVEEMLAAMEAINQSNGGIMRQITESHQQISEIVRVILEIGEKTKVINDIVFQTKLLSFNASVEAARAGEHGSGFAVVAQEVGNLAQMSGNAAKEIGNLLKDSTEKVEKIVTTTSNTVQRLLSDGKSKTELGTKVASECHEVLEQIVQDVSIVSARAREIVTACIEQSKGVNEITKAIGQLDAVTQQNVVSSEASAKSAEALSGQAESLKEVMKTLMDTIRVGTAEPNGEMGEQPPSPPASKPPPSIAVKEVPSDKDPRFKEAS